MNCYHISTSNTNKGTNKITKQINLEFMNKISFLALRLRLPPPDLIYALIIYFVILKSLSDVCYVIIILFNIFSNTNYYPLNILDIISLSTNQSVTCKISLFTNSLYKLQKDFKLPKRGQFIFCKAKHLNNANFSQFIFKPK